MKIVWEQGNFEPMEGPQKEPGSDQTFYLSPFFFLLFDSKAYFTPGGIFRKESRFRDDVATKSLRIVYIELTRNYHSLIWLVEKMKRNFSPRKSWNGFYFSATEIFR